MNGRINVVEATTSTDVSVESVNAIDGAFEAGEDLRVLATADNVRLCNALLRESQLDQ